MSLPAESRLRDRPLDLIRHMRVSWAVADQPLDAVLFNVVDPLRAFRCNVECLCSVCGHGLAADRWYVAKASSLTYAREGELDQPFSADFREPPMHRRCAEYALRVCPHLRSPRYMAGPDDAVFALVNVRDALIVADPWKQGGTRSLAIVHPDDIIEVRTWRHGREVPAHPEWRARRHLPPAPRTTATVDQAADGTLSLPEGTLLLLYPNDVPQTTPRAACRVQDLGAPPEMLADPLRELDLAVRRLRGRVVAGPEPSDDPGTPRTVPLRFALTDGLLAVDVWDDADRDFTLVVHPADFGRFFVATAGIAPPPDAPSGTRDGTPAAAPAGPQADALPRGTAPRGAPAAPATRTL